jgi:PIN domain nuclease of toxin-antitoxin system
MNIVIDTNVLYSWVKIFENDKLTSKRIELLTDNNELYITTTSILEFIVKHRQNLDQVKKCLEPLFLNKLKIISIGFTPISNEHISKIYFSRNLADCSDIIDQLFNLKIEKETEFLRFFFIIVVVGSIDMFLKESSVTPGTTQYNSLIQHSVALIESNSDFLYQDIYKHLLQGYDENKIDPIIKKYFSEMLFLFLYLWKSNYYLVKNNSSLKDVLKLDTISKNKIIEEILIDKDNEAMKEYLNMNISTLSIFKSKKYKEIITEYVNSFGEQLKDDKRFTEATTEYIAIKLNKYFSAGKKMEKNDCLDFLILYSLYLEEFFILTLDKDMINILETIHPESFQLISSTIK